MSLAPIQISTPSNFAGSLSATTTLTGVTAGNHIILLAMHGDLGGSGPTLSASDGQGAYGVDVLSGGGGGVARTVAFRLTNAAAGTHTIVCTASGGTTANSVGTTVAIEVPPVILDQSSVNGGSSAAASVAATAALHTTNELALAAIFHGALLNGGGTFPPAGGTGSYTSLAHLHDGDADYQVLTSTAGVGADWGTMTNSSKWTALVAAYMAAVVPIPYPPLSSGGMIVQICQ